MTAVYYSSPSAGQAAWSTPTAPAKTGGRGYRDALLPHTFQMKLDSFLDKPLHAANENRTEDTPAQLRPFAIAICAFSPASLRADSMAYMLTDGEFGTLDLNTGKFSVLGAEGGLLVGPGVFDGVLYADSGDGQLYTVNTANGAMTAVGSAQPVDFSDFGSTTTGLYGLDSDPVENLYSINPQTGQATEIGSTGVDSAGLYSLSTNSATLYATATDLYTISTSTGQATSVGAVAANAYPWALVFENGTLYSAGGSACENGGACQIFTINPTDGASTAGPDITGLASGDTPFGLAPDPLPTPEPATWALLAASIAAMGSAAAG